MPMPDDQTPEELEQIAPVAEPATAPEPLSVDLSEDDDDEAPERAALDKKGRRARLREARDTAKAESERATRLERELAELRGQVGGMASAIQRPAPTPQGQDPAEREIDTLDQQQSVILRRIATQGITQQEQDQLTTQYKQLDRQRYRLLMRAELPAMMPRPPSQEDLDNRVLAAQHPRILSDPALRLEAQAEMVRLVRTGKPVNLATAMQAARAVEARNGLGSAAAPSDSARRKHQSVSGRAGAAGGAQRFTPNKAQLSAARAYSAHIDGLSDEEAVKRWVKGPGRKLGIGK